MEYFPRNDCLSAPELPAERLDRLLQVNKEFTQLGVESRMHKVRSMASVKLQHVSTRMLRQ